MALLLADENLPIPTVTVLQQHGYDILTLLDLGMAGLAIPDDEILTLGTSLNRCVVTQNRKDFIKLHKQHPITLAFLSAQSIVILRRWSIALLCALTKPTQL
ncbi:DUF5615 family PIN-like protein [Fibrella sp. HMF5335]|uniref:DUF5615 family PIN-like protein n=1 Tax=Fibrella rubiginis TaxID=2817060 RepID=A0A939GFZ7_9BACT|nr:DUF5615 family PIN-like protein [Fibrella rubiginis]MBO0937636.1 DUF5615 family PIN-like protein [Fibrella rubiginis]